MKTEQPSRSGPGGMPLAIYYAGMPLCLVFLVFSYLCAGAIVTLTGLLQLGRRLLESIPGAAALGAAITARFHRGVQPLANRVLKDPRDEAILAALILVGITSLPIFVAQLALVEINWYLVALYYAFVYGPNQRAFVRSFSAMHLAGHHRDGIFKRSSGFERLTGNSLTYTFFSLFMGLIPHNISHTQQHHRENAGPLDIYETSQYDHTSVLDFISYTFTELMHQQFMISTYFYFKQRNKAEQMRSAVAGNIIFFGCVLVLALYSWQIALLYLIVPWFATNIFMAVIHWTQHTFYGGQTQADNFMYNTVTLLEKPVNHFNEGYHVCHHHWKQVHWTESPRLFEELKGEMKAAGSLVFDDISSLELFFLLMFKRFDALAEKLRWWVPISHEEKVALLRFRSRPAGLATGHSAPFPVN